VSEKQIRIVVSWQRWDEEYPDISTEQLMHRVCTDCNCDETEVAEALERQAEEQGGER